MKDIVGYEVNLIDTLLIKVFTYTDLLPKVSGDRPHTGTRHTRTCSGKKKKKKNTRVQGGDSFSLNPIY